jgi:acyl-CoA thioesterase-1
VRRWSKFGNPWLQILSNPCENSVVNPLNLKFTVSGVNAAAALCLAAMLGVAGCKDATAAPEVSGNNLASAPASIPPAKPASETDTRPLLVCFGDSLTAGYGTDPGESYPDVLQKLLDAQGYPYRVLNSGISGNTTKDGLERIARVIARHPQIVVVEFGGNDGLRGLPIEQTKANLAEIIDTLQKSGTVVALAGITLPPDYGKDYIAKFDAMYTAMARQYHVRLLPFLLQGVYGVPGDMQEDATHATAKGNKQVAANVEGLIKPLLKR